MGLDKFEDFLEIAIKNLKRRKLRSWLTIIGIIVSVGIIFLLISLSLGLESAIQEQFREFGTDKFFIQPKGTLAGPGTESSNPLTLNDINALESVSGVKDYSYWSLASAKIEYNDEQRYFQVIGIPLDKGEVFLENGFYEIDTGKFLKTGDEGYIGLGYQYKYSNLFSKPIDVGDTVLVQEEEFKVRAIMASLGNPQDDRMVIMPLPDFESLFPSRKGEIDQIIVQIEQGEDINLVASKVEKKLRFSRDVDEGNEDFTILTPEELLDSFSNILNILTAFLLGVAFISLLVGAIGVANTMYTSVLERTQEIGVLKAVGAKNSDVLTLFTMEAGLLGLMGGVIGIIFGALFGKTIEYIAATQLGTNLLQVSFPLPLIISCLAFAFIIGCASGALPAYNASKIRPVEALRYE